MKNLTSNEDRIKLSLKIKEIKALYKNEMLMMAKTGNPLSKRYTASDIVTILEELEEQFKNL